jgi:hypothetical protein
VGITKEKLTRSFTLPDLRALPGTESMKHMKEAPFLEVVVAVISRLPKLNVV